MAELGVRASVQPAHLLDDRDVTERLWPDRADRCFAFRWMLDDGVELALGLGRPGLAARPVAGDRGGRAPQRRRPRRRGTPSRRSPPREALAASRRRPARRSAPGRRGDLVLLDADPLAGRATRPRPARRGDAGGAHARRRHPRSHDARGAMRRWALALSVAAMSAAWTRPLEAAGASLRAQLHSSGRLLSTSRATACCSAANGWKASARRRVGLRAVDPGVVRADVVAGAGGEDVDVRVGAFGAPAPDRVGEPLVDPRARRRSRRRRAAAGRAGAVGRHDLRVAHDHHARVRRPVPDAARRPRRRGARICRSSRASWSVPPAVSRSRHGEPRRVGAAQLRAGADQRREQVRSRCRRCRSSPGRCPRSARRTAAAPRRVAGLLHADHRLAVGAAAADVDQLGAGQRRGDQRRVVAGRAQAARWRVGRAAPAARRCRSRPGRRTRAYLRRPRVADAGAGRRARTPRRAARRPPAPDRTSSPASASTSASSAADGTGYGAGRWAASCPPRYGACTQTATGPRRGARHAQRGRTGG